LPTRLTESTLAGWRAITLAGEELEVVVLPERGAEIYALVDLRSEMDLLFHAPWGLSPPGAPPAEGSDGHVFLERYAGGWQELFPSVNGPSRYGGETIPFHGEVANVPWECFQDADGLTGRVSCSSTPFDLERRMRLEGNALVLDESVTNRSSEPAHFVWGHHSVVGPPFLEAGCRLDAAVTDIVTIDEMWEDTARLEPGQRSAWPHGQLRAGGTVDLREVPGPEERSHDDVYLGGVEEGYVAVENGRLGMTFRLEFDPEVFRWLISWQPYGGAMAPPLGGSYALGIEPWVSRLDLAAAVRRSEAIELPGGDTFHTVVRARIERGDSWPR
jgi:hypothetical protein